MALDFYSDEINENLAKLKPVQDVEPGIFANFLPGTGQAIMKGFAEAGRGLSMLGASHAVVADKIMGGTTLSDRYFAVHDDVFNAAVDRWTAKPNEVGVAGEVVGKLISTLPLIMAGPAGVATALTATTMGTAEDLVRKNADVSAAQAVLVGSAQAAGLATGIWMPILGQNLAQRVLLGGAGFNVVQGVAAREISNQILSGTKAAKEFEALDPKALTIDVLLGLAFGGIAHYVPSQRQQGAEAWGKIAEWAKNLKPSEIDALLVLRGAQVMNSDTLPGKPATPADVSAHVDRVRMAIDQLASDRPVNVEDIKVSRETTLPPDTEIVARQTVTVEGKETERISYRDGTIVVDGEVIQPRTDTTAPIPETITTEQPRDVTVDSDGKIQTESTVTRQPMFEVDPVRVKESERIAADMMEAAQRVRLEEGLLRPPEVQTIPPKDITPLEPEAQARAVGQHIERKLLETGMQRDEAMANAAIWEAFAKSAWERYEIPPAELLTKYGVDVRRMDSADKLLGTLEQRYNQIDTPAFKAWFGNSKVTTPDGKPLVVYHGTFDDFDAFRRRTGDIGMHFGTAEAASDRVDYLTPSRKRTNGDSVAPNVMPVFLSIKNPLRLRDHGAWNRETMNGELLELFPQDAARIGPEFGDRGLKSTKEIREFIQSKGYDGIVYRNTGEVAGAGPFREAERLAREAMNAVFPKGKNAFSPEDQQVPEYKAWKAAYEASNAHREASTDDSYIAFERTQIKSAIGNRGTFDPNNPNILFQSEAQPFYSQLTRQIEGLKATSAPAKGWKDTIKGLVSKGVVKQAEIEPTGLNEWLDLQKGKVTKQQVQDYLAQNGVNVEEVVLGKSGLDEGEGLHVAPITEDESGPWGIYRGEETDPIGGTYATQDDAYEGLKLMRDTAPTKFGQYQLPGGKNYRELLLTLPGKSEPMAYPEALKELPEGYDVVMDSSQPVGYQYGITPPGQVHARPIGNRRYATAEEAQRSELQVLNEENNVRAADAWRARNAGSQFQSSHFDQPNILSHIRFNERTDAEGKKVLFIEEIQSDWAQKGKKSGFDVPTWNVKDANGNIYGVFSDEVAAKAAATEVKGTVERARNGGVPSAPFVGKTEAWVALSLKRMIRYAAENGFDRVAWTTGEQQAARYDLSKQVDGIAYQKLGDSYALEWKKQGDTKYTPIPNASTVKADKLADLVGKEVAEKIVAGEGAKITNAGMTMRELAGLDLKVGGEGMKAFYDKIMPNIANDVLKKLSGGRVGKVELFGKTEEFDLEDIGNATPEELAAGGASSTQPGFDITPALREKAMAGMPLFQGGVRGAVNFDTGKTLIALFENADKSTFQHETAHVFLEMTKDLASRDGVPMGAVQDWATLAKWLKIEGGDIPREAHEQFARGWEKYLAEGVAPNEGLKGAFKRFRDWLIDIYKSLMNIDSPLNNQVRGVMARMLESQAKDPISKGGLEDARLQDPEYRTALEMMARNAGWAEEGGRIIRDPMTGEVSGRTQWIAHEEWYQRLQQDEKARLPGGRKGVERAVQKAVMGEPMTIQEKRAVTYMLDEHRMLVDHWNESGANIHPDGDPFEIANLQHAEGIEPTAKNTLDMALIDRARQVDPDALENIPTNSDDATFMAAVKEIVDAHKPAPQKADQGGEEAPAQTEHVGPQARGAGSPPPPGGEAPGGAAAPDMLSRAARAAAAETPDLKIQVGKDPDGKPIYKSANDFLDEAELEARIATESDINLIAVAAECLMGIS